MRPAISGTIFVQFLLIGVVLGLTVINLQYFSGIFRAISAIIFFTACLLQTFPFCYLCELLVEDSRDLSDLLAQSHWLDAEPRFKSTLRIFMINLQKPIIFIAGGIFPICIKSNFQVQVVCTPKMLLESKKTFISGYQDCIQRYDNCGTNESGRTVEINFLFAFKFKI